MASHVEEKVHCQRCKAELPPGTNVCPHCRTDAPVKSARIHNYLSWRYIRHLLLATLLFAFPAAPHVLHFIRVQLPLGGSPLVSEAVTRANRHEVATARLGQPIVAGWLIRGLIRDDETGWSEGRLWIPVSGSIGSGTLYARAGRGTGPWVFSELELAMADGAVVNLLESQRSTSAEFTAKARPYLVPLGDVRSLGTQALIEYYRTTFGLEVQLLAPLPLESRAFDATRNEFIAEELIALMKRHLPELADDPSAVLIGLTEKEIFIRNSETREVFSYRESDRFAIISSARLKPALYQLSGKEELLRTRVRKMVSKNIGLLVYRLPQSDDPTSLLYHGIKNVDDIDLIVERFQGRGSRAVVSDFTVSHRQAPVAAELITDLPAPTQGDGGYPCLLLRRAAAPKGNNVAPFTAKLTECLPRALLDTEVDEVEVDLRYGMLLTRKTDLFVADAIPLVLTRCYRLWDQRPLPFGANTNHVWDMNPTGSRQPYTYVDLHLCDGNSIHYDRISKGTGYADAVYEHRQTATPFFGSRFSWNGNGWDLKLRDGSLLLFPEAYAVKRPVEGAIVGIRDAAGRVVRVDRDRRRNLEQITSPHGRFIAFEQDANARILRAVDDQKRVVSYTYDPQGRLAVAERPDSVTRYAYDDSYLIAIYENDRRLVDLKYLQRRVAQVSLPDGQSYQIRVSFDPQNQGRVVQTSVTGPDGTVSNLNFPREP